MAAVLVLILVLVLFFMPFSQPLSPRLLVRHLPFDVRVLVSEFNLRVSHASAAWGDASRINGKEVHG